MGYIGHLVELTDPKEYDNSWKTWKIDYLPKDDLSRKPSQKEKFMTRKLINKYGAETKSESFTLGDLMKISNEKKNKN